MLPSLKLQTSSSAADSPGSAAHARYLWGAGDAPFTRSDPQPERLSRHESLLTSPRSPIVHEPLHDPTRNDVERSQGVKETDEPTGFSDDGQQRHADFENTSSDGKPEKKKMKRFRLTHNQTRFLMSEFTRQAHPDAAHRERLSREIPGLSPRQVQVWFQNRRAKLKRLTQNDRERILKSRALPEDFDTSQVLRSPFDGKSSPETVLPSPRNFMAPNPNPGSLKMLHTEGLQRPHGDDYMVSPMSSASAYISPATPDRTSEHFPQPATYLNRASLSAPVANLQQRNDQGAYPFSRSNSCSEAYGQPSPFGHAPPSHADRFARTNSESLGLTGLPPVQRAVDYDLNRPPSGVVGEYDSRQHLEHPVSPPGPGNGPMPYSIHSPTLPMQGYQQPHLSMPAPKPLGELEMNPHMQPPTRPLSTLNPVPVSSEPPPYRPPPLYQQQYGMNTMAYGQPNGPTPMGLPGPFHTSDPGSAPPPPRTNVYSPTDARLHHHSPMVDPSRNHPPFEYPSYM